MAVIVSGLAAQPGQCFFTPYSPAQTCPPDAKSCKGETEATCQRPDEVTSSRVAFGLVGGSIFVVILFGCFNACYRLPKQDAALAALAPEKQPLLPTTAAGAANSGAEPRPTGGARACCSFETTADKMWTGGFFTCFILGWVLVYIFVLRPENDAKHTYYCYPNNGGGASSSGCLVGAL